MTKEKFKIAAVADIHVKESDHGQWVQYFKSVSSKANVLIICGDLTYSGTVSEAEVLAEELKACTIPVIFVLGNHDFDQDQEETIINLVKSDNVHLLEGESITIDGVGFAGIKGFGGGFDKFMMPMFGEPLNKKFVQETVNNSLSLEQALVHMESGEEVRKKFVLLHYAPISDTIQGEPKEIYPFLGSSRFGNVINNREVEAVFHGHAHYGKLTGETSSGTKVFNVAMPILEKSGYDPPVFIYEVN